MTYEEALDFIHSRIRIGSRKGLDRIRLLMERLGNPQKKLRFVHVAGSNGKGSTVAMCESILRCAGYKTGMFVSPYVFDFRERIQIEGQLVDRNLMAQTLQSMLPALEQMKSDGMECTEFEVVTALSLMIFAQEGCDIVLFEVGIGGKLDCTNVIDPPLVAVIGSVSLEHTDLLGNTLGEIAEEKCGIIKEGSGVVEYCCIDDTADKEVLRRCSSLGITPVRPDTGKLQILSLKPDGTGIIYDGEEYFIALAGEHQVYNALSVLAVMELLRHRGFNISRKAEKDGLASVCFVGRLQVVRKEPLCVIDGAHNPEKISSLCKALDSLYKGRPLVAVMGMLKKKDYKGCIPQIAMRSSIFIAVTPDAPYALPAEEAAAYAKPYCDRVMVCSDPCAGAQLAVKMAPPNAILISCGSLYMIGETKKGFLARK